MCRIEEIDDNLQALNAPPTDADLAGLEADRQEFGTVSAAAVITACPAPTK
jgi:hypothetical protein